MKYRINATIEDYYDYVGTNPHYSKRKRVLASLPSQFAKHLYNLKYKTVYNIWGCKRFYRVHFSVDMEESEIINIVKSYQNYCHRLKNYSYKPIRRFARTHSKNSHT